MFPILLNWLTAVKVFNGKNLHFFQKVAATRLQNKLSELGRPESEINAARQIVREAAHKVKNVHKRFGGHVVTVNCLVSLQYNYLATTTLQTHTESDKKTLLLDLALLPVIRLKLS